MKELLAEIERAGALEKWNLTVIPQFSMDLVTWSVAGIKELNNAEVSQDGVPNGFTRRTWKIEGSMPRMYLRLQVLFDD